MGKKNDIANTISPQEECFESWMDCYKSCLKHKIITQHDALNLLEIIMLMLKENQYTPGNILTTELNQLSMYNQYIKKHKSPDGFITQLTELHAQCRKPEITYQDEVERLGLKDIVPDLYEDFEKKLKARDKNAGRCVSKPIESHIKQRHIKDTKMRLTGYMNKNERRLKLKMKRLQESMKRMSGSQLERKVTKSLKSSEDRKAVYALVLGKAWPCRLQSTWLYNDYTPSDIVYALYESLLRDKLDQFELNSLPSDKDMEIIRKTLEQFAEYAQEKNHNLEKNLGSMDLNVQMKRQIVHNVVGEGRLREEGVSKSYGCKGIAELITDWQEGRSSPTLGVRSLLIKSIFDDRLFGTLVFASSLMCT